MGADVRDIYSEPVPIPPIKLIDRGELRRDLEAMYLRHSRPPGLVSLDLRAGISGNGTARESFLSLVERYGEDEVDAVLHGIIDNSERAFLDRIGRLRQGTWRERGYLEQAYTGDRGLYPVELGITNTQDGLIFSNAGTAPQIGVLNCTYAGWRAATIAAVSVGFCYDMMCAFGGPLRQIRFERTPGTLCTAEYPAAVGNSTNFVIMLCVSLAANALSRMMVSDSEQRPRMFTPAGISTAPVSMMSGTNQHGDQWAGLHMEIPAGGVGGFATKDGIPTGGVLWSYGTRMPDAESEELDRPLLFLYRRHCVDSGGAGRWARGVGPIAAQVAHGTEEIDHDLAACGVAVPTGPGLFGGYPGSTSRIRQVIDSDIRQWFAEGKIPTSIEQLDGKHQELQPKSTGLVQRSTDVHEYRLCAGAGYGDPLLREPELVLEDVQMKYVSEGAAATLYGVRFTGGEIDLAGTEDARQAIRRERLGGNAPSPIEERDGDRIAEYVIFDPAGGRLTCRMCGHDLGEATASYKDSAHVRRLPLESAGPLFQDASAFVDAVLEFRQFCCPGCATLLETETAREEDPILRHIELVEGSHAHPD